MLDRLTLRLLLAQGLDVITVLAFYLLIGAGTHEERNPLILALMALGGLHAVALFKMGVALIVSWRYHHPTRVLSPTFIRVRTIAISVATASGIAGAGFNLGSIIHSLGGSL
jgi:hypothetical protein